MDLRKLDKAEGKEVGKPKLIYVFCRKEPSTPEAGLRRRLSDAIAFRKPRTANAFVLGEREEVELSSIDVQSTRANRYFYYAVQFYRIPSQKPAQTP
jgi:hypothetical protein